MFGNTLPICVPLAVRLPAAATADELTEVIQKDLVALCYDSDSISGEMNIKTIVAISTFQAAKGMVITGEVTPLLLEVFSAEIDRRR